ncbi:MAG TPA: penicillin acylase family protein [Gemmatimonadaceae bacterium]|nr:penicillin acylase family protein [Gemmatimonadaceae bacterium]
MRKTMLRPIGAAVLLAVLLLIGARRVGPAPALGGFLDPAHGVWALARNAELPNDKSDVLASLASSVEVRYDRRGVPHIFATREEDAYRALGYVVARDRLFQLWIQAVAAGGRLTEIAGARALPLDREMRRLGMTWSAERKMAQVDSSTARLAGAYADGVNAYIEHMSRDELPLEFRLLGMTSVPKWEPINSLLMFNRMGWTLAYIAPELERAVAAARVGSAAAASLFPENSPIQEPIVPNGRHAPRFDFTKLAPPGASDGEVAQTLIAALGDFMPASSNALASGDGDPRAFASNNWAVAPAHSATGNALLAGDPHLELTLPSIWYEAQLVVPGALDVYGVTIPGLPGITIGFNRDIAWTFTNTSADVLDFYTEKVDDDAHPTKYLVDKAWRPLEQRIERYRGPKGEVLAVDTLYFTHRGPMRRENGQWLSMRWTVLEPSNEIEGFRLAAKARDVTEFQQAMGLYFRSPAQNMLVTDRHGSIAIRSTGRFPIRPSGGSGFTIRDGTTSESDWRGYLPVDFAPQVKDPGQGYVASANQQPIDPHDAQYWLGGEYDPWRAMRINQILRADSAMTVDKMRLMQTDPGSAVPDYFVPYFLNAAQTLAKNPRSDIDEKKLAESARLLGEWDRRYTKENTRAVLFDLAYTELVNRTWDELEAQAPGQGTRGRRVITPSNVVLAELLADSTSEWWDDRSTPRREARDDILAASLVAALDTARRRYGDPKKKGWTWSRVRHANIWHPLRLPSLSALDLPIQGGRSTLNPSVGSGAFGSSWRMVVEAAPNELKAWGTYPGGESGNPASSRYENHLKEWMMGELQPLLVPKWIPELGAKETVSRLTLRPRE